MHDGRVLPRGVLEIICSFMFFDILGALGFINQPFLRSGQELFHIQPGDDPTGGGTRHISQNQL